MGLFDKVFKSQRDIAKEDIKEVDWHQLTDMDQLESINEESSREPVAIFKHSTRCGISRMVLKRFETALTEKGEEPMKLYFLDLLANRGISNEIASKWGVEHESPQLLILKDGKVVYHTSHEGIKAQTLEEYA